MSCSLKKNLLKIPGVKDFLSANPDIDIQIIAKIKKFKTKKVTFKGVPVKQTLKIKPTYLVSYPEEGVVAFSSNLPTSDIQAKLEAAHKFIGAPVKLSPELNKISMVPVCKSQTHLHLYDVIEAMFDGANDEIWGNMNVQGEFTMKK